MSEITVPVKVDMSEIDAAIAKLTSIQSLLIETKTMLDEMAKTIENLELHVQL